MLLDSRQNSRTFSDEHRQAWVLLLLRACEKTGLHPVDLHTFHRLIYFGNCLAEVYRYQPPSQLVMKQEWGPYYPRAQFDLDRLVIMGQVDIAKISWESTPTGVWKKALFSITATGFALAVQMVKTARWFEDADRFLFDLCAAYANLSDDRMAGASREDLTYSQPGFDVGSVIVFSDASRNPSALGARAFAASAPPIMIPNRQHQLRLYMQFLEGKAA
jgi:hypothetical protein